MMSISQLLQAAEYLEKKNKDTEHGYASSLPYPGAGSPTGMRPFRNEKTVHSELEKNRRATLRRSLDRLEELLPWQYRGGGRNTTLGLLMKVIQFMKHLQSSDERQQAEIAALSHRHQQLYWRLHQLSTKRSASGALRSTSTAGATSLQSSGSSEWGTAAAVNTGSEQAGVTGVGGVLMEGSTVPAVASEEQVISTSGSGENKHVVEVVSSQNTEQSVAEVEEDEGHGETEESAAEETDLESEESGIKSCGASSPSSSSQKSLKSTSSEEPSSPTVLATNIPEPQQRQAKVLLAGPAAMAARGIGSVASGPAVVVTNSVPWSGATGIFAVVPLVHATGNVAM